MLIEDVHWLDEASRGLIMALARVTTRTSIILTVAHRPPLDETNPILPNLNGLPNYHELKLDELSSPGIAALVANHLQGPSSPLLLDVVQVQSSGNPFFVEEMIGALRESNHLSRQADETWTLSEPIIAALRAANSLARNKTGQWILNRETPLSAADLGLPDSIREITLSRLDYLLEDHKLTLKVASVIGQVFQFQLLAQIHPTQPGRETLLQQTKAIEAHDFIREKMPLPHLTYIFRHTGRSRSYGNPDAGGGGATGLPLPPGQRAG